MPDYGNINKFLAAKSYGSMLSIVERDARAKEQLEGRSPQTVGDLMLVEILKRLHVMRGIAARAAHLPLSDGERRICQRELEGLKAEIDSFATSIPASPPPEDAMQPLDDAIARVGRMVDEWAERTERRETSEGAGGTAWSDQTAAQGDPSEDASEEAKIARWMDALMRGWGQEPDDSEA